MYKITFFLFLNHFFLYVKVDRGIRSKKWTGPQSIFLPSPHFPLPPPNLPTFPHPTSPTPNLPSPTNMKTVLSQSKLIKSVHFKRFFLDLQKS